MTQAKQPVYETLATIGNTIVASMDYGEWLKVKKHPRQRSSKDHSKAVHFKKMKHAKGVQYARSLEVSAALLNGKLFRTDGHTRTYLWETGGLPEPKGPLQVTIHEVSSYEELNKLYETIDSRSASKSSKDNVVSALRGNKMLNQLRTREIRNGHIKSGIYMAIRSYSPKVKESLPENFQPLDLYKSCKVLKIGILTLDQIGLRRGSWHYGTIGAALLTMSLWPETEVFWEDFNLGYKKTYGHRGELMSPVAALLDYVGAGVANGGKKKNAKASRNPQEQRKLMGTALRCVIAWRQEQADGEEHGFSKAPIAIEPSIVIEEFRKSLNMDYDVGMFMPIKEETRSDKTIKTRKKTQKTIDAIADMSTIELRQLKKAMKNQARLSPEVTQREKAKKARKKKA